MNSVLLLKNSWLCLILMGVLVADVTAEAGEGSFVDALCEGSLTWSCGAPLLGPMQRAGDVYYGIKDPSIVHYDGQWHLFCTVRTKKKACQIEYLAFEDWCSCDEATRHILDLVDVYHAAPQVLFFSPQKRWYLIYQVLDKKKYRPAVQPVYSTTQNIADPRSWSKPRLMFPKSPDRVARWIDFWTISDGAKMHLFFTSNDGRMWRAQTSFSDFPRGWNRPEVVLRGDIFEASHTYRLTGWQQYLTIIEARLPGSDQRYFKAYLANRLDGDWRPAADSLERPFAGLANVRFSGKTWTDSISHGELLRCGCDEKMEVDPMNLRFLFQGVQQQACARQGLRYVQYPWRLSVLERISSKDSNK